MHIHRHNGIERALVVAIVSTFVTLVLEVIGGVLSGSLSLLSDAGHMLRDVIALFISLAAIHVAEQLPSHTRTFGYHRVEIFAAFVNGLVLIAISFWIFLSAFRRIQNPEPIHSGIMFGVALVGLGVNLYNAFRLHGSHDLNVRSAFLHVVADTVASFGVIIASIWIFFTGQYVVDSIIGFGIGVLVLVSSMGVIRESVGILLEFGPKGIVLNEVIAAMEKVEGVTCVYDLHLWSLCSNVNCIEAHVVCHEPDLKKTEQIKQNLRTVLAKFNIRHVTLEFEYGEMACKNLFEGEKVVYVKHQGGVMNVFEFARKMEQDGEQYYRTLAKTVSDKGLVSVLTELADAEVRHKQVVEEMQKATARELQETPILEHAKNIFSVMENKGNGFSSSEIEAYKKALKIEKASEEFYRQKARELGNRQQSELFEQIAEEERKHYFLIENIIEFMQRPAQWLENAEWNHLDEY